MDKKVIVAGHVCLDITPEFPEKKNIKLSEYLSPGKLHHVKGVDIHTGGAVANTGLAMKILGADVSLVGKVGQDEFGDIVCSIMKKYGADGNMIRCEDESTSYTVVLAIPGTDRIFFHNPGANDTFSGWDISDEMLEEAALLHFGYPPIIRSMYENNGEQLISLMKRAKAAGTATSLDMAAVDEDSPAAAADWKKIIQDVLPLVDFFVPSVEELCYMLDRERFQEWQVRPAGRDITEVLDIERDVKPLADQCMEYGAKVLLIKCGVPGMYYRTAGADVLKKVGSRMELPVADWADREGFERSYVPDRVLSGTGAGDTSIAAFLTSALKGYPLEKAMHLAAATGASCVAAYDALGGLKPLEELEKKIAAGWKKCGDQ